MKVGRIVSKEEFVNLSVVCLSVDNRWAQGKLALIVSTDDDYFAAVLAAELSRELDHCKAVSPMSVTSIHSEIVPFNTRPGSYYSFVKLCCFPIFIRRAKQSSQSCVARGFLRIIRKELFLTKFCTSGMLKPILPISSRLLVCAATPHDAANFLIPSTISGL